MVRDDVKRRLPNRTGGAEYGDTFWFHSLT
jgi:hypothetical protein